METLYTIIKILFVIGFAEWILFIILEITGLLRKYEDWQQRNFGYSTFIVGLFGYLIFPMIIYFIPMGVFFSVIVNIILYSII